MVRSWCQRSRHNLSPKSGILCTNSFGGTCAVGHGLAVAVWKFLRDVLGSFFFGVMAAKRSEADFARVFAGRFGGDRVDIFNFHQEVPALRF